MYDAAGWTRAALIAVQLAGVGIIARSVAAIDPLELAGIRPAGAAGGLQVAGPYRLVRHPLYLGWILVVSAAPSMTGDRLLFAVVSTIYLLVAIPWEERELERTFGAPYRSYKADVRWRVLPPIY
jgi:protein-S-isoprenylcysteine O-methyltransferase Ste14